MNEKVLKSLYDILLAIEEIDTFFINRPKSFDIYCNDTLQRRGIERNLEIIGEAMNRILKDEPDINIGNAKRIVGLRKKIIHGYDSVSDENIWGVAINHLPQLKKDIQILID